MQTAFLAALDAGLATLAIKNDAAGSLFHAFDLSAPAQPPVADDRCMDTPGIDKRTGPIRDQGERPDDAFGMRPCTIAMMLAWNLVACEWASIRFQPCDGKRMQDV